MKGICAFDIDGTLTHKLDWIDPRVVATLDGLTREGWHVALITGRIFSFAWEILQHLPFSYLLAVQNGADVFEMPSKKFHRQNYLDASILKSIEKAYEGQEEDFIIYAGMEKGDFCYFRPERFSKKMRDYIRVLEGLSDVPWRESDFQFQKGEKFALIKCFGKEEPMRRLYQKLNEISQVEATMIRDPIDPSLYLCMVTHPEANKGSVVRFLREHFQTPFVIAAGDDHNDLKMLKEADLSIAMRGAPKELCSVADIVSNPATEAGIIGALEEAISRASR